MENDNDYSEMDGTMGAPESEVRMVESMYENTKRGVVVGSGTSMSTEFQVNIGLIQGITFHRSNGDNEQKDQHHRCSEEGPVRSRSCDRCRTSGRMARRTVGVEGVV